jgi:hypothetical protein
MGHLVEADAAVAVAVERSAGRLSVEASAAVAVECSVRTEERVGIEEPVGIEAVGIEEPVGIEAGCCIRTTLGFLGRGLSSVSLSRHRRT